MKKVVALAVMAVCVNVFADLSIGGDFRLYASDDEDVGIKIMPSLIIDLADKIELNPFAGFSINESSFPIPTADFGLIPGCGLYFHLIERDIFLFSLGPAIAFPIYFGEQGQDDFWALIFDIYMPVNLDFRLSQRMFMRMGLQLAGLTFTNVDYDEPAARDDYNDITFSIRTIASPFFGFYFNF
ncbi:MAG: hypothetical protein GF398_08425 [Chitinivibrionales bacterium]|nr:hypothetical protein [Chitinivibrionales bacterium]